MSIQKNQLNCAWNLWYECRKEVNAEEDDWSSNQMDMAFFDSIEDFWGIYNHILPVNKLRVNSNYMFFKAGIHPSWEDEANSNGGSWRFGVRFNDLYLEEKWLTVLLSVLGETLDPTGSAICGVSFLVKSKGGRIEVWMKDVTDKETIATVGQRLRALNVVDKKEKLEFRKHGGEVKYII